jgi:hypothetical protein
MRGCRIKLAAETATAPKALPSPDISARTLVFVPVKMDPPPEARPTDQPFRVRICKGGSRITIEWPVAAAGACAAWLRELVG